jgi:signal transduction histidine kinase
MLAGEAAERAPELGARIDSLRQRIEDALAVTRRLAGDLRRLVLDDLGLVAALEWLLAQARGRASIDGRLDVRGEPARLREELATAVFRIAQESLTNVMRHAAARHVELLLDIGDDALVLRVRDDGRGIDRRALRRGLGLLGIEERARLLGGQAAITDAPGGGTSVEVRLPLSDRSQPAQGKGTP